MIVRELITRLGFNVDNNKLKGYERGINNIKTQADSAANAFRGMFAAFVGITALKLIANTADDMQSLEARIGMLPQTIGEASDAFSTIAQKAIESRTSIESYGSLYVRLAGATKNFLTTQEDVLAVTSAISNALVVGGAKSNEAASAILQLSQAFQKGKLDGDEFRAFMETMSVDVKEKLAKELGANDVGDLFKMSSNGELTAKRLAEAFKKLAPEIKKQMMQMPMTIGQAGIIIVDRWQMFIAKMNRESGAVTKIANFFLKGFDMIEAGLSDIVEFFGGATQAVKFFGIALAAIALPFALQAIVGLMAFLLSPIALIVGGLVLIGLAIEDIYQWATGGKSIMGALFGDFDYFMFRINGIVEYVKGLFEVIFGILTLDIDKVASGFKRMFKGLVESFFSLTELRIAIAKALKDGFNDFDFASFFSKIGDKLYYALSEALAKFFRFNFDLIGLNVPSAVGAGKVASAGVAGGSTTSNVTINQTLPVGTSAETKQAAYDGVRKAAREQIALNRIARQAGQAQ